MKRLLILALLLIPASSFGQVFSVNRWCELGGQGVVTQSLKSKGTYTLPSGSLITHTGVQASYPSCQVDVYNTGTSNHATIYANVGSGALGNPFTANVDGSFLFFAAAGCYDVTTSGGGMPTPHTETDVCIGGSGTPGSGTLTNLTVGNLAPLFTTSVLNPTTTPAVTYTLSNFAAHKWYGNNTGSTAAPGAQTIGTGDLPFTYSGSTTLLATVGGTFAGTGAAVCRDASGNLTTAGCTGSGVVSFNGRSGAVTPQTGDYAVANVTGAAPTASPALTGVPTAPTAAPGTNTTQLATTAFVISNGSVTSFNARTGAVTPQAGDYSVAQVTGAAPLASPSLTGVPLAPTAAPGTNTTQIATTAFVLANPPTGSVVLAPAADQAITGGHSLTVNTNFVVSATGDLNIGSLIGIQEATGEGDFGALSINSSGGGSTCASVASVCWNAGNGSPEGVLAAHIGSIYSQLDSAGGAYGIWVKSNGVGITGWVQQPVLKVEDCGTTTVCAKTVKPVPFVIFGDVTFPGATTVSLSSLPFTSSSSYSCSASDLTTAAGVINFTTYTSGSAATLTETGGTNTDHAKYVCAGF